MVKIESAIVCAVKKTREVESRCDPEYDRLMAFSVEVEAVAGKCGRR